MGLVQRGRVGNAISTILIIIFSIVIWQRQNGLNKTVKTDRWEIRFEQNQALIHKYLDLIYNQYNHRKYDEAQNTFLDLRQMCQYQDVDAKSVFVKNYLPSDSLQLLNTLLELPGSNTNRTLVIEEIRRINLKLSHY